MARDFYPFVERQSEGPGDVSSSPLDKATCSARIAVYDDAAAAPRVVVVDPKDTRSYLEEITATVTKLSHDQGGSIPFMVIREVVENLIHAYFQEPAISILADGNTIRFADQGPGIREKARALEYGTTSATEEMKRYIRGVGSGLPYAQQYLEDKGGSLEIEDNIIAGTIVTIRMPSARPTPAPMPVVEQQQMQPPVPQIYLSDRGKLILSYLAHHESVGPTELVAEYGYLQPTWSRELRTLENEGIITKRGGQKRFHTEHGRRIVATTPL